MSATMVSVTVIDSDGASDFAAPEGTTVAGLCAMLAIDLSLPSVRVSYADGRPLDGADVLGRDLPAGSTIAVSSRVLSAQQLNEASERHENQWLSPVLALLGYCFIVFGAVSALCLLPMVADAALVGFAHPEEESQRNDVDEAQRRVGADRDEGRGADPREEGTERGGGRRQRHDR